MSATAKSIICEMQQKHNPYPETQGWSVFVFVRYPLLLNFWNLKELYFGKWQKNPKKPKC